ncbi:hypothetical protein CCACVL1_25451 [Corchorus capsularis]|uniref:Uncharacterized protein n=1 Tax=Corchorus capsularis TaxID=210143 RepID=A0A1R3GKB3_COCAP|nr:hypothetical protein CCACVL1_25451 [Corchorus capsularis]
MGLAVGQSGDGLDLWWEAPKFEPPHAHIGSASTIGNANCKTAANIREKKTN